MPANKNALIRYKTIDRCLRDPYRRWTLDDLVDACAEALLNAEGIASVSTRTVQADLQVMRSDKLGYNAPIEVYDRKYYRYSDPDYCIMNMPMSPNETEVLQEAVDLLDQLRDFEQFAEMADVVSRLQDKLSLTRHGAKPIVQFDNVPDLKGLRLLSPLYAHIAHRQPLRVVYQSFGAREPGDYLVFPHLLKEFRNRWFLFCSRVTDMRLYNLALDRVVAVEPLEGVDYRDNPDFDPEHFFDDVIGVSKNVRTQARRVSIWANREQSRYIATKPLHPSQRLVSTNAGDGSCVFELKVVVNFELYSVLLSYGPGIRVLKPRRVAEEMRRQLQRALALYDSEQHD